MIHKLLNKKGIVCMLTLVIMACTFFLPKDIAKAESYHKTNGNVIYSDVNDFKTVIPSDTLKSIKNDSEYNFVEILFTKDGEVTGNPVWFKKNAPKWSVNTPKKPGEYIVKIYKARLDGEKVHLGDGAKSVFYTGVKVGKIEGGKFSSSVSVNTKKQIVDVLVKDIISTYDISTVKFIFTNSKGKEVYRVKAKNDGSGKYYASVNAKKLTPQYGTYDISAEVKDKNGAIVKLVRKTSVELEVAYTEAQVRNADIKAGTFDICTDRVYAAGEISKVVFKVWCKGETADLHKYVGTPTKYGKYTVTVDAKKHKYSSGKYQYQVVVILKDGKKAVAATGSKKMNLTDMAVYGKTNSKFIKKIYIYNPTVKSNVYAKLWSKVGGGVDEQIYNVTYVDGRLEMTCTMSKLKGPGTAYLRLFQKNGSEDKAIKTYKFSVEMGEIIKTGWHYTKCSDGKTYKLYYEKGKRVNDVTKILNLQKESKLHAQVNRTKNRVTIYAYDDNTKEWCIPVISFKCSVGLSGTPTPKGTYNTDRKHRWKLLMGPSWGQYATHITGGIYFHSVAGGTTNSYGISSYSYNKLGMAASHGCIRLTVRDAKWIYDYCALGLKVNIYDGEFEGPLEPQDVPKIPYGQHYDPTDPAVKK